LVHQTVRGMGARRRWHRGPGLLGLWWAAVLGVATPGLALEPHRLTSQYNHESWRSENGLPQNSGLSLAQTADGYLWVGTHEGLARFDGARFTVLDRRSVPELRSNSIEALKEDASGTLWVGTSRGVLRYEGGQLRRLAEDGDLAEANVLALTLDSRHLWIGTHQGLVRYALPDGGSRRSYTATEGLPVGPVQALAPDGEAGVWVGALEGLAHVSGDTVEPVALPAGLLSRVESLLKARDGTLWIGTSGGLLSLSQGQLSLYGPAEGVPRQPIAALLEDRDGNLWVGTEQGIVRRTQAGFARVTSPQELVEARVESLLEDRSGHLWIGTANDGVHRLSNGPFVPFGEPEGFTVGSMYVVLETRDGALWVGTQRGGLERWKDGAVTRLGTEQGLTDPLPRTLAEGPDGSLWVGTNAGAFRYDGKRFVRLGPEQGMPPGAVTAMAADSSGGMWFATLQALAYLRDGQMTRYGQEQGFVPEVVMTMATEPSGALWYGTTNGLVRLAQGTFRRFTQRDGLAGDTVRSLYLDGRGTVWVGFDTGLSRLKGGRITRFTTTQGLPEDTVFTLLLDAEDFFWMSNNKGISRVSRRELEEVADGQRPRVRAAFFDERDGMRAGECNGGFQPPGWRAQDGRMWFATVRGAVLVDPKDARLQHPPPRLHIEEVRVQGQPVPLAGELELGPGQDVLDIRFTAFVPRGAEKLPFRYRLRGYDAGWVDAEGRRVASYTRLPPSSYRFEVTTLGRDGQWVEPGAVLELKLEPWFYETWWFYALALLAVGGVAATSYAWRVGRLKQRERWLQARVEERTQELARANQELDANLRALRSTQSQLVQAGKMAAVGTLAAGVGHEINNPLSYIVSNVEHACQEAAALERLDGGTEESRTRLREMQQVLREALMGADRVRRIVRDLKTFSRQEEDSQVPVDLRGVLDSAVKMAAGELRPRAQLMREYAADVPMVQGSEPRLAQVFLNLIINAAQALPEGRPDENEVRLVLRRGEEGEVVAEVRDTGSGIPPEVLGRIFDPFFTTKPVGVGTGLGLALCQSFIASMGGKIDVESEVGRGTVFRVTLPAASLQVKKRASKAARDPEGTARVRGRVLIVDDDPLVSSALRRTLVREHEVEMVVSSRRALEMLTSPQGEYDVILCDLMMPELTGMELHEQLERAMPERARRMVFVTGGAYTPEARAFLERVSNPRVEKPFDPEALRAQVRDWVALRG
jgi:ligand-binding sensor domain-containing protein/signal transduction histidine kinase/CheY-like chemotaxis protein